MGWLEEVKGADEERQAGMAFWLRAAGGVQILIRLVHGNESITQVLGYWMSIMH